jgi:fatty-acyl-CoA synthase
MPDASLSAGVDLHCYEDLLAAAGEDLTWPDLDEEDACALCYTSGTTGNPKGVLYSHRSTVLHTYGINLGDTWAMRASDRVMPVVPMFHVNAWGAPYGAPMVGAALVLPGSRLDGASLQELMTAERVTMGAGVPTVWQGLLDHLHRSGTRIDGVERLLVGGSACPPHLIRSFEPYGVRIDHGWGMTEISPLGAYNRPKPSSAGLDAEAALRRQSKQGRALFGVDWRIVDDEGRDLPWDGVSAGHLLVRGHWVCAGYYGGEGGDTHDPEGWLRTGDIATIDPDGYLEITDRAKDLIKSGGEWISSLALESVALAHPDVAEAAVIAARHPVWNERPLLLVVAKPEREPDEAALLAAFGGKVSTWWVPDAALVVPALPRTATGKLQKVVLRQRYGDHYLRAVAAD